MVVAHQFRLRGRPGCEVQQQGIGRPSLTIRNKRFSGPIAVFVSLPTSDFATHGDSSQIFRKACELADVRCSGDDVPHIPTFDSVRQIGWCQ